MWFPLRPDNSLGTIKIEITTWEEYITKEEERREGENVNCKVSLLEERYLTIVSILCSHNAILAQNTINFIFEACRTRTYHLANDFTVIKNHQGRDGLDTKTVGNVVMLIDVHLSKTKFPLIFLAKTLVYGIDSATRTTPSCPEIYNNGGVRFENFLLKILISNMKQIVMCFHNFSLSISNVYLS